MFFIYLWFCRFQSSPDIVIKMLWRINTNRIVNESWAEVWSRRWRCNHLCGSTTAAFRFNCSEDNNRPACVPESVPCDFLFCPLFGCWRCLNSPRCLFVALLFTPRILDFSSCRYKNSLSVVPPAGLSVIITGRQTKKPNNVLKCISINVIRVNSPLPRSHNPLGCHTKSFQAFFLFALSLTCFVFESQKSVRRMFKISSSVFLRTAGSIVDRRWQKVFFYSGRMDLC